MRRRASMGRGLVVADAGEAQEIENKGAVVVHEGVAGVGVLLDVVGNQSALEGLFEPVGISLLPLGQSAVTTDDGAGCLEEVVHVRRKLSAVVDAGGGEAAAGDQQHGESAAHAEADDAGLAVTVGLGEKPGTGGFNVVEGRPGAGQEVADDGAEAEEQAALVVEVDGDRKEAGFGKPIGLVAVVLAHSVDVVKDDDAGDGSWDGRSGKPGGHLAARGRNEDVGHGRSF